MDNSISMRMCNDVEKDNRKSNQQPNAKKREKKLLSNDMQCDVIMLD